MVKYLCTFLREGFSVQGELLSGSGLSGLWLEEWGEVQGLMGESENPQYCILLRSEGPEHSKAAPSPATGLELARCGGRWAHLAQSVTPL